MDLKDIGIAFKTENNEASDGTSGLSANVQTAEVCLHNFCALFVYKLQLYEDRTCIIFLRKKEGSVDLKTVWSGVGVGRVHEIHYEMLIDNHILLNVIIL